MLANGHTVMAWAEYLSRLEVHKCQQGSLRQVSLINGVLEGFRDLASSTLWQAGGYICIGPQTEMAVPLKMSSEGAPNVLYPFFHHHPPSQRMPTLSNGIS